MVGNGVHNPHAIVKLSTNHVFWTGLASVSRDHSQHHISIRHVFSLFKTRPKALWEQKKSKIHLHHNLEHPMDTVIGPIASCRGAELALDIAPCPEAQLPISS